MLGHGGWTTSGCRWRRSVTVTPSCHSGCCYRRRLTAIVAASGLYEGAASSPTDSDCRLQALSQFVGDSNQATDDGIYTNSLISLSSLSLSDDFDSTPELTFNAGPSFQHLHVVAIAGQHTLWCLYYMINNADLLDYLPLRLYIVFVHFTVSFLFFPLTSNHLK